MKRLHLPKRHFCKAISQSVNRNELFCKRRIGQQEKEKCHHKYVWAKTTFANSLSKEILIYANNEVALTVVSWKNMRSGKTQLKFVLC